MSKKFLLLLVTALVILSVVPMAFAQNEGLPKIGFLPGVVDPFYQVMQLGVEAAAKDFGVEVVTQIPDTWGATVQAPILNSLKSDRSHVVL